MNCQKFATRNYSHKLVFLPWSHMVRVNYCRCQSAHFLHILPDKHIHSKPRSKRTWARHERAIIFWFMCSADLWGNNRNHWNILVCANSWFIVNIARGTTDPGYWVYNLNHVSDWNHFEIILAEKDHSSYELNTLGPLCLWQCFMAYFPSFRNMM